MPSNINIENQIIDSRMPCLLKPVIMKKQKSQAMLYLKIENKYSY
jgi:hypothetical protein